MRNLQSLVAAATLIVVAAAPAAAQSPKKYALLIGLNQYLSPRVVDLQYATKDVNDLLPLLLKNGYTSIGPLINPTAARDNIVAHLYRIAAEARPEDSFLLYFAGHGVRGSIGRASTYWLTYDATFEQLDVAGIRLTHLLDYVADIKASQKIVILDHCFSGDIVVRPGTPDGGARDATSGPTFDFVPAARGGTPIPSLDDAAKVAGAGTVVIAAARGFAYELDSPTGGNGLLTTALLKALKTRAADANRDAKLSVNELTTYLESEVWELSNQTQRPQIYMTQSVNPSSWILADKLELDDGEARRKANAYVEVLTRWLLKQYTSYDDLQSAIAMLDTWTASFGNGRALTEHEATAMHNFETLMSDNVTPDERRAVIAVALINAFHGRE